MLGGLFLVLAADAWLLKVNKQWQSKSVRVLRERHRAQVVSSSTGRVQMHLLADPAKVVEIETAQAGYAPGTQVALVRTQSEVVMTTPLWRCLKNPGQRRHTRVAQEQWQLSN